MLNRSLFDYRFGLVVILGTLIIATLGCSFAWNMLTRGTLQGDLDELFHQRVSFDETTCQMIASSRSGFCLLEASSSAIETLVDKLNLEEVTMNSSVEVKSRYHVWEAEGGCRKNAAFFDLTGIRVFISERRAIELRLGSGSSFEYLMLYYNPANDALCVQVSYAYS